MLQFELAGCSFRLSRTRLCWYKLGPRTNTRIWYFVYATYKRFEVFSFFFIVFPYMQRVWRYFKHISPLWFYCCIDVQQIHVPMCSQSKVKLKILQIIVQFLNVEILLNTVRTRLMKSVTDRWYLYWNWLCQITKPSK